MDRLKESLNKLIKLLLTVGKNSTISDYRYNNFGQLWNITTVGNSKDNNCTHE